MNKEETEAFSYALSYLQELILKAYTDCREAVEPLKNYNDDLKYSIALSYLSMANQSYLEAERVVHEYQIYNVEIESFFGAYEDYKFEFKKVISGKDKNTSWLFSRYDILVKKWKEADEFLKQLIELGKNK